MLSRGRLTDHARRRPGLPVARRHATFVQGDEAVLQLLRAPLVVRRVPAFWDQPGRARNRARVPGAVRQVAGEHFAFIGRNQHVVIRRRLGEHWNLALDLRDAAVGAARAAGVLEYALLHDLGAETSGGAPQRVREQFVVRMRSDDEQPAPPFLPDQVLREPVRQH